MTGSMIEIRCDLHGSSVSGGSGHLERVALA